MTHVSRGGAIASIAALVIMFFLSLGSFVPQLYAMTSSLQRLAGLAGFIVISYLVYVIPVRVLWAYIRQH